MVPSSSELSYFYVVANALNISRAACQLGISQPALTLAIKRLEFNIGTHLFIRHKKGVTLTQAGKNLLAHVKPLLSYWNSAKSQSLLHHDDAYGSYTIGCHSTSITQIARFLPELLKTYPNLEINIYHDISRKITEQLINLTLDIGIVSNPVKHQDLIITKLYDNEFSFWISKQSNIRETAYSEEATVLICDPALAQTQLLLKKIKNNKIRFSRILTVNSLESVASLTASGCGIGILPTCLGKHVYSNSIKKIIHLPVHSDPVCLVYRHENRAVHAIQLIIAMIKKHLVTPCKRNTQ